MCQLLRSRLESDQFPLRKLRVENSQVPSENRTLESGPATCHSVLMKCVSGQLPYPSGETEMSE